MKFRHEQLEIAYDDSLGGQQTILLVHGHPFDRSMWRSQFDAIAQVGWRVVAPDLRGYGESRAPIADAVTLDVYANDVLKLMDHLGVRKAVLGGLSMGGQIVMEFCRLHPERVAGLLLAATFPQAEHEQGRQARRDTAARLLREGMEGYAEELLPKMLGAHSIETMPGIAAQVLQMMRATAATSAAAALRGRAERPDYSSTLRSLDVPALIVVGTEDAFTTVAQANEMRQLLKRSRLVCMAGIGHMPNLERAEEFNRQLTQFLAEVRAEEPLA